MVQGDDRLTHLCIVDVPCTFNHLCLRYLHHRSERAENLALEPLSHCIDVYSVHFGEQTDRNGGGDVELSIGTVGRGRHPFSSVGHTEEMRRRVASVVASLGGGESEEVFVFLE